MARACLRYQTRAVMLLMIRPDFRVMSIERIHDVSSSHADLLEQNKVFT